MNIFSYEIPGMNIFINLETETESRVAISPCLLITINFILLVLKIMTLALARNTARGSGLAFGKSANSNLLKNNHDTVQSKHPWDPSKIFFYFLLKFIIFIYEISS